MVVRNTSLEDNSEEPLELSSFKPYQIGQRCSTFRTNGMVEVPQAQAFYHRKRHANGQESDGAAVSTACSEEECRTVTRRDSPVYPQVKVKVAQLCPTLCDPMDYAVHGLLQARILEWISVPFSRGSSQPRGRTQGWNPGLPHCRRILYQLSHKGKPIVCHKVIFKWMGEMSIMVREIGYARFEMRVEMRLNLQLK